MGRTKPPYPAAFKQQMVELAMAGRTPAELAREFGVSAQSITAWVARAAADAGEPIRTKSTSSRDVLSTAEREELARLRRQVRQLQQERDILAKATVWFAVKDAKTSIGSTNS
jgi:transposase